MKVAMMALTSGAVVPTVVRPVMDGSIAMATLGTKGPEVL